LTALALPAAHPDQPPLAPLNKKRPTIFLLLPYVYMSLYTADKQ
jgi:hypothetical protein